MVAFKWRNMELVTNLSGRVVTQGALIRIELRIVGSCKGIRATYTHTSVAHIPREVNPNELTLTGSIEQEYTALVVGSTKNSIHACDRWSAR